MIRKIVALLETIDNGYAKRRVLKYIVDRFSYVDWEDGMAQTLGDESPTF